MTARDAEQETPTTAWPRALTARELQVVTLVADGLSCAEIGGQLGISGLTVKTHLSRIAEVVGVETRAGIVGACLRAGVIE